MFDFIKSQNSISKSPTNGDTFIRRKSESAVSAENAEQETTEQQADDDSCRGWESDPQSFCIKVAKHFLNSEFGISPAVTTVNVSEDGGCHVNFDNGAVITVQKIGGKQVWVNVSPHGKGLKSKSCTYSYECFVSGKLELTKLHCT